MKEAVSFAGSLFLFIDDKINYHLVLSHLFLLTIDTSL